MSACSAEPEPLPDPGPIQVYGNVQTFEIAPVLLAAEQYYSGTATVRMGSIVNLVGEPPVPGFGVSDEVIAEFAPDAPLRGETFAPYPRIAPMGFHFANTLSGREPDTRLQWSDGDRRP